MILALFRRRANQPKTSKKKRPLWWRILRNSVLFLLLVVLSLPVLIFGLWQVDSVRGWGVGIGLDVARGFLHGKVDAKVAGNLWDHLIIHDVRWDDREGQPMVALKRLEVRYDLLHFVRSGFTDLKVEKVALQDPKVYLDIDAEGKLNILKHLNLGPSKPKTPPPKPKEATGPSSFKITVPAIEIEELFFNLVIRGKRIIRVRKFGMLLSFRMFRDQLRAHLKRMEFFATNPVDAKTPEIHFRNAALQFGMDTTKSKLWVQKLALSLGKGIEIRLPEFHMSLGGVPIYDVKKLHIVAPQRDIVAIVPPYPLKPDFEATITAGGALDDLTVDLGASLGKLKLKLKGKSGILRQTYQVNLIAQNIDLHEMMGKPNLKCHADVKLSAAGKGFSANTNGEARIHVGKGFFQRYKYDDVSMHVGMKEGVYTIHKMVAKTPYANVNIAGKAQLEGGKYDMNIRGNVPSLTPVGRLFGQKLAGKTTFSVRAIGKKWIPVAETKVYVTRFRHPSAKVKTLRLHARFLGLEPIRARIESLDMTGIRAGGQYVRTFGTRLDFELDNKDMKVDLERLSFNIGTGRFALPSDATVRLNLDTLLLKVRNLRFRNRRQEIAVGGRMFLKGEGQDLRVRIKNLDLAPLKRELGILRKKRLEGIVSMDLRFAGSFPRPVVDLEFDLRRARYDTIGGLATSIRLGYKNERASIRKLFVSRNNKPLIRMNASLPVRLNLKKFPRQPVLLSRSAQLSLDIPDVELSWIAEMIKQPLDGRVHLFVRLDNTLGNPRLAIKVALEQMRYRDYKHLDLNLMMSYKQGALLFPRQDTQRVGRWFGHLRKLNWFAKNPSQVNWIARKGRRLMTLNGDLPLTIRLLERRGSIVPFYQIDDRELHFELRLLEQKVRDVVRTMSSAGRESQIRRAGNLLNDARSFFLGSLTSDRKSKRARQQRRAAEKKLAQALAILGPEPKAANAQKTKSSRKTLKRTVNSSQLVKRKRIKSQLVKTKRIKGKIKTKAKTMTISLQAQKKKRKPLLLQKIDHALERQEAARRQIAQLSHFRGRFGALIKLGGKATQPQFDLTFGLRDGSFCPWTSKGPVCLKKTFRYKKKKKVRSLRIKGVQFQFNARYRPAGIPLQFTQEEIAQGLNRGFREFARTTGRFVLLSSLRAEGRTLMEIRRTQIALDVSLNPKNFAFKYRLHEPIEFHLNVPKLSLARVARFYRLPILRKLRGKLNLRVDLSNRMSEPNLSVAVDLDKGAFLWGRNEEGKLMWLDGLKTNFSLVSKEGKVRLDHTLHVLDKLLMDNHVKADLLVGMNPSNFAVKVKAGKEIDASVQFKDFPLQRFAKMGGVYKSFAGILRGNIKVRGDLACPRIEKSFLAIDDGRLGYASKELKQRLEVMAKQNKKKKKKVRLPILHFKTIRFDVVSMPDGRIDIQLNMLRRIWSSFRKAWRTRPALRGFIHLPFDLGPGSLPPDERRQRCPWVTKPLDERLKVELFAGSTGVPLNFLNTFVPGMEIDGYLDAAVDIRGTLSKPRIKSGRVGLELQRLIYPEYGVELRKANCRRLYNRQGKLLSRKCDRNYIFAYLKPKKFRIEGQLQGKMGRPFSIRGVIAHREFVPQSMDFKIRSRDFRPMATPRYRLTLQTQIDIKGPMNAPQIIGKIVIPQMLFTLPESSHKPGDYSEDKEIIVLGEPSEKRLYGKEKQDDEFDDLLKEDKGITDRMLVDLRLIIPRNFWVRNRDISIEAKTDDFQNLHVLLKDGRLKITGGIELVRGELQAYGKRFRVEPGSKVSFTGQSVRLDELSSIDPTLGIVAKYLVTVAKGSRMEKKGHKKVLVLLKIKGSAFQPDLDFEVRNAQTGEKIQLDRINAISLILTGSTTDDLSQGQQKSLTNQAVGMVGGMVASELKNALSGVVPLDVLNVETGTSLEDLQVTLGWYLTPSVYSEFALKPVPLEEESLWEVKINIAINRNWSLEFGTRQIKRNDELLFQGSGHVFFRMKY